ncbi:unnamed protein product [Rotaria sordida]|nr:unnamed protein product [Rotaria sordida]
MDPYKCITIEDVLHSFFFKVQLVHQQFHDKAVIINEQASMSDTKDTYEQLWHFIIHLNSNSQKYIHLLQDIYHKENLLISIEQWIDQSLITQCLSQQLSYIENDIDILEQYYYSKNF